MSNLPPLPEPAHRGTDVSGWYSDAFTADQLKAFAEKAVKQEREACAKLVQDYDTHGDHTQGWQDIFAERIRARSQEGQG